jgi:hypothetical protein
MVVLPPRARRALSLRDFSLLGVVVLGPVPVNVHSDTPSSKCRGDCLDLAMLDLGEYRNLETDRDTDLEKKAEGSRCLCIDSPRRGVDGDEVLDTLVATLVVRARGEGVNGIRPPAVLVEKMPWWLLRGVDTCGVAMSDMMTELTNQCFGQGPVNRETVKSSGLVSCRLVQSELVE